MQTRAYLKVGFANGKQRASMVALLLVFAVAIFGACAGNSEPVVNVEPATTAPADSNDSGDTVNSDNLDDNAVISVDAADGGESVESFNSRIAFTRGRHIYTMLPDGSDLRQLTDYSVGSISELSWSPDGSRIAFHYNGSYPHSGIYTISPYSSWMDYSDERKLEFGRLNGLSWSPDGERIALYYSPKADSQSRHVQEHFTGSAIFTASSLDGSDWRRLTNRGSNPTWSPDGSRIAFTSGRDGFGEIYTVSSDRFIRDGSDMIYLTDGSDPSWSPDSSRIAFSSYSYRDSSHQIYTMSSDGSDVTRLTAWSHYSNLDPSWSPDGTRIAFIRNGEIYTMASDGSDVKQLTDEMGSPADDLAWSPVLPLIKDKPRVVNTRRVEDWNNVLGANRAFEYNAQVEDWIMQGEASAREYSEAAEARLAEYNAQVNQAEAELAALSNLWWIIIIAVIAAGLIAIVVRALSGENKEE